MPRAVKPVPNKSPLQQLAERSNRDNKNESSGFLQPGIIEPSVPPLYPQLPSDPESKGAEEESAPSERELKLIKTASSGGGAHAIKTVPSGDLQSCQLSSQKPQRKIRVWTLPSATYTGGANILLAKRHHWDLNLVPLVSDTDAFLRHHSAGTYKAMATSFICSFCVSTELRQHLLT